MHIFHNWKAYEAQTALGSYSDRVEPTRPVTFVMTQWLQIVRSELY
jgi:hypothetical protein